MPRFRATRQGEARSGRAAHAGDGRSACRLHSPCQARSIAGGFSSALCRPLGHSGPVPRLEDRAIATGDRRNQASPGAGAHLVRHSLATELVSQRRPINEVADLLGHRSMDTTAIYVKVAVPQLAEVALPFPGGA